MSDNNDNDDRTIYCGNLSEKATEQILYELFFQVGPVERVSLPKDKDGIPRGFAFITFEHLCSVRYAIDLFYDTKLFGRNLTLKNRNINSNNDRNNSNAPRSTQSLAYGFNNSSVSSGNMIPNVLFSNVNQTTTQQFSDNESQKFYLSQQQILLQLAGSQMFGGGIANNSTFPSGSIESHNDRSGHKNEFVDRNRNSRDHQKEHKPYSRNRSRSPTSHNKYYDRNQSRQKTRSRSPSNNRSGGRDGNRDGSNRYSLWANSNSNNNNNYNNNGGSRQRDRR